LNEEDSILRSKIVTLRSKTLKNKTENAILKSQFATSRWGGDRKSTYVFTEQGIAMLSSVLKSDRAISVNIQIIRIFTKLREMIDTYKELREKVEEMERSNTKTFHQIFDIIKSIIKEKDEPEKPKNQIGFTV
jgi:DNA-binding PadR family transcriptional regulator